MAGCVFSLVISGVGAVWLFQMAEAARWGGLSGSRRSWALISECAGERFLALIRTGNPPDLAWSLACEVLIPDHSDLASAWGPSVWEDSQIQFKGRTEQLIASAGASIKKAVQVSLMEGRPCSERVETAQLTLRQNVRTQIDRELSLLSTRGLKPLFICIAPALIGLLAFGLWLTSRSTLEIALDAF
jgi:hypothetical protein